MNYMVAKMVKKLVFFMVTEYPFQSSQMPAKATHRETIIFVHTLMSYSCKGKGEILSITGHEDPKWE